MNVIENILDELIPDRTKDEVGFLKTHSNVFFASKV